MRYVLKQKFWSFGDAFRIRDAEAETFSWSMDAPSVGAISFPSRTCNTTNWRFIRQKLLSWGPTYEIERESRLVAVVKKKLFTLLRCRFTVDVPGPDDLEVQGSLLDHEYAFERHGQVVAQASKKWFSWTDTYGVDINAGEDPVVILASAVVIDLICHQESKD